MPPRNPSKIKNSRFVNVLIAIFILLPLSYLVISARLKTPPKIKNTETQNLISVSDSASLKLQAAIKLCKSSPNENNYLSLGLQYYNNSRFTECVEATKKAIEYNPESFLGYNNLCSAYNQLELWDLAIATGRKAHLLKPGNELAKNNLEISLKGKASLEKEITETEQHLVNAPGEENCIFLGNLYYKASRFEKAIASYQQALTFNNKNAVAYNNICSAYNELKLYQKAIENCEKALKVDTANAQTKNNLALAKQKIK